MHPAECELVAMDGTGHTSDYTDKYYAQIRGKSRKSYIKNHIYNQCRHMNDSKL